MGFVRSILVLLVLLSSGLIQSAPVSPACSGKFPPSIYRATEIHPIYADSTIFYIDYLREKMRFIDSLVQAGKGSELFTPRVGRERELVDFYDRKLSRRIHDWKQNKELLNDPVLGELAQEEVRESERALDLYTPQFVEKLANLVVGDRDECVVEIHVPADEFGTPFAAEKLYRMYLALAQKQRWTVTILEQQETKQRVSGRVEVKAATFKLQGKNVLGMMLLERGLHKLIHTNADSGASGGSDGRFNSSFVQVRVFSEAALDEMNFSETDVEFTTMRASGAGGQHVNRTESAVMARHIPTGLRVSIQNERSQHRNKQIALEALRAKVFALYTEIQEREKADLRRASGQTASGARYLRLYDMRKVEDLAMLNGNLEAILELEYIDLINQSARSATEEVQQSLSELKNRLLSGRP